MIPRTIRLVALTVAIVMVTAARGAAQNTPAVFLHGLNSQASDWAATAARLEARVAITPFLPDYNWFDSFEVQAQTLQQNAGLTALGADAVAIGHSNGGVLAREWTKSRPLAGIITIGTPHQGAPLIPHLAAWAGFNSATPGLLDDVLDAFSYSSPWIWVFEYVNDTINWVSDFSVWSVVDLALTLGVDGSLPVAYEMAPGSPYFAALNSGANLAREAAAAPNRVGITSIAHNYYWAGPARAIAPAQADAIATTMYAGAYSLLYWSGYLLTNGDPTDPATTDQSLALLELGEDILSIDPYYCRIVSTPDASDCFPNDGVVPDVSQQYPGAANFTIGTDNDGPAHIQEIDQSDDALYDAAVFYLHIPPPGSAAPPAPPTPAPPPAPIETGPVEVTTPVAAEPTDSNDDSTPTASTTTASTTEIASVPSPPSGPGVLAPGQTMMPGTVLTSSNGLYHFTYQGDGNLVLYDPSWAPLWSSGTVEPDAGFAVMQNDGNFVIYNAENQAVWWENAGFGDPGTYLVVEDGGDVTIDAPDGTTLWTTDAGPSGPVPLGVP